MASFEADKVIVELLAKTEQFDTKMTQSAATMEKSSDRIASSADKAEKAVTGSHHKRRAAAEQAAAQEARHALVSGKLTSKLAADNEFLAAKIEAAEKRKQAALAVAAAIRSTTGAKEITVTKAIGTASTLAAGEVVKSEAVKTAAVVAGGIKSAAAIKTVQLLLTGPANPLATLATTAQPAIGVMDQVADAVGNVAGAIGGGGGGGGPPDGPNGGLTGKGKILASVMGGLGGIITSVAIPALLAGAAALYDMATSNGEANDAIEDLIEKMKEQAKQSGFNEDANRLWEASIYGVAEAQRKLNKEVADSIPTQAQQERVALTKANETLTARTAELDKAKKDLAAARARVTRIAAQPALTEEQNSSKLVALGAAQKRVDKLKADVDRMQGFVATAEQATRSAGVQVARSVSEGLADRSVAISNFFKDLIAETEEAANAPGASKAMRARLAESLAAIKRLQKASEEADKQGVDTPFKKITAQTNGLNQGKLAADRYAAGINGLASSLTKAAAAAKKLADEAKKTPKNEQSGRTITDAEARRIATQDLGLPGAAVTSQTRSAAHNAKVGGQADSLHLTGQAIDIDKKLANAAGLTLSKIVAAFEKRGVRVIEKLDEGDHYHLGFAKRGGAGKRGPSPETLANRAAAAERKRLNDIEAADRRDQAARDQIAQANQSLIDARQALIESAEEIAKLEIDAIELARQDYNAKLQHQQKVGSLLEGEVKTLTDINDERARLRTELVKQREEQRKFRVKEAEAQLGVDRNLGGIGAEQDLLESRQQVAKTQRERREIERRLLTLQFQEERIQNDAIIASAERLRVEMERIKILRQLTDLEQQALDRALLEADLATARNGSAPERQANATEASDRGTAGPLESYFGDIRSEAGDINEAFEAIAAGGLATFTDALTDAIVNFTSLKDVGRAVLQSITAALVKLAIQQVILAVIGKTTAAAAATTTAAQMAAIGAAAAGPAALVSLATSGANSIGANAGMASTAALAQIIGAPKARGGRIFGPGSDTSDNILTPTSPDEFVIRASSARRLGFAALERMNMTGELPELGRPLATGGRVGGRIRTPSNGVAMNPRSGNVGGFSEGDIASLRGIVSEAARAMPSVGLYASLDPADVLQRALGSPAGEKALIASLGRNSGRVKATIG